MDDLKGHTVRTIAAVVSLSLATSALAQTPDSLQPVGPWKVDYAQEECRLTRTFGTGDKQLLLRIARGGTVGSADMVLAGKGLPKLPSRIGVKLTLTPQSQSASSSGYSMSVPGRPERFLRWYDTSLVLLDQAVSTQTLHVEAGEKWAVSLNASQFSAAMTALQTCYADLLKGWGVDDASIQRLIAIRLPNSKSLNEVTAGRAGRPKPKGNMASWVTTDDYPTEALQRELGGTVIVVLTMDSTGVPEKCNVAVSSKVPALDAQTCAVLVRRARYQPVTDEAGNHVSASTVERVRWIVPTD